MAYVMDHQAQGEAQRMSLLESWADPGTKKCLDSVGVRAGWQCLEVGAGTGSIARWLCDRVGPGGQVVATEVECSLLDGHGLRNLEIRRHDIVSDPLPDCAFDLVHARMVLEHLPDRLLAMHKLVCSLKPGGWLVVEDQDIASVAPAGRDSEASNMQFMVRSLALARLLKGAGVDLEYGRRLYCDMRSEDLVDISAEGRITLIAGGSSLAKYWQLTWEQLGPRLVGSRLLSEWDVQDFLQMLDDPKFVWMSPALVTAWGRRAA